MSRWSQYMLLSLLCIALLASACTTPSPAPAPVPTTTAAPAPTAAAPNEPAAPSEALGLDAPLPIDTSLTHGQLDNGLKYYLRANAEPRDRAQIWLAIKAGSAFEDDDQQGLAHFLEHLAFNGTERFEKQELVSYLEDLGMRFGPDLNAYTTMDETVYTLTLPTDRPEVLETAFDILEDWATAITFDPEEIDKERGVVTEEWRLGRGAGARLRDRQLPLLLQGSRYAERLPIGLQEVIESAPPEAFERFYRDWYRPELMAVIAVGDFDVEQIEGLLRDHFGDLENPAEPRPTRDFPVPEHEEPVVSVLTDPELTNTILSVYYKHPKSEQNTGRAYRQSIVEGLYHSMLNARLAELGQGEDPPFLFARSSDSSLVRTADAYVQSAGVESDGVLQGLEALLTEARRVRQHGFTAGELERTRKNVLRGYERAWEERETRKSASFASEYLRNFLVGESIPGIALELELAERFLPEITLEEVNALAGQWITDHNRVILVQAPEKDAAQLPTESQLLNTFDQVAARQDLEPWVDKVLDEPLLAEAPTPGKVVEESTIEAVGLTEWRLSNGVRVVLKPTDFKKDQVLLSGWSPGGHSLVDDDRHVSAVFADSLIGEGGLGDFGPVELQKAMAGKAVGVAAFISELEEGIQGGASPQDLETLMQLVYLHFTAPRTDQDAYAAYRARLEAFVANRLANPAAAFEDEMRRVLSNSHPRRRPVDTTMLGEIDLGTALEVYRERFADASDFTFVLVGTFEPDAVRPLIETYLGSLPTLDRQETWRDVGVEPPKSLERVTVERGLEPKSQVRIEWLGETEWNREEQHLVSTLGRALGNRLREVLREDLGGTYGVGVSGQLSRRPKETYGFRVSFGCAPENVDTLVEAVFTELRQVQAEGLDPKYLEKVKEAQRRSRETQLRENGFWMAVLKSYLTFDLDPTLILEYDPLVDGVTNDDLQRAAQRYLPLDRYVLGILLPEESAGESSEPSP